MSSTSSPPDASNVVHGVFPTQALRVGDGRRFTPERLPEEEPRGVEEGGAASAENSGERRDTPEPPEEEAQACFAFIAGDDKRLSDEQSQAPTPAADGLPGTGQATVSEAMAAPPLDVLASDPREGDGRATADGAGELALGTPPEEATPGTAGAEPYAHGATHSGEELAGGELAGGELAGGDGAHAVDPREVDPAEIDPRELAPHEEASHDGAEQAIPGEKDFEAGLREEADELAAQEVGRQEGDAEHTSREKAAYEDAEIVAAAHIAAPIAPPGVTAAREVTFPTLARASVARAPHAAVPTPGAPRPLTRALDAAARLAADANAAAAALDSLKRLLQQGLPASGQAALPRTAPAAEHRPQRRPAQLPPRPPPPPPPERPTASASLAAVHAAPLPPADRARFDVRGFFAGVALSCAIGIVLYLFMTAG